MSVEETEDGSGRAEIGGPNFRANVGIMIVNSEHRILAGDALHNPGEWMMPQGGINPTETTRQALRRELNEETGLSFDDMRLVREYGDWLQYRFRRPQYKDGVYYVGQRQQWFLLEYNGPPPNAKTVREQEFSRFDWVEPEWLVRQIPAFKKDLYRTVLDAFRPFFP